jgi:hypothetical protein
MLSVQVCEAAQSHLNVTAHLWSLNTKGHHSKMRANRQLSADTGILAVFGRVGSIKFAQNFGKC